MSYPLNDGSVLLLYHILAIGEIARKSAVYFRYRTLILLVRR